MAARNAENVVLHAQMADLTAEDERARRKKSAAKERLAHAH
jgi:hypothetical protein